MKNDKWQFVVAAPDFYLSFDRKSLPGCEGFRVAQIRVHLWFRSYVWCLPRLPLAVQDIDNVANVLLVRNAVNGFLRKRDDILEVGRQAPK